MIGYYVHHVGRGHATRAAAISALMSEPVVVLSSLPRPASWTGSWIQLDRDDLGAAPVDVDAGGTLHWVPLLDDGLASRMSGISSWILRARPTVMVVDISVEVAVLARLHGVPVITFALPGDRGDRPHTLGYDLADTILACWPPGTTGIVEGLSSSTATKVVAIGAISRFRRSIDDPTPVPRTVLLLAGAGGSALDPSTIDAARRETPGWTWTVLDGTPGTWIDDPWPLICAADVVITHAGQNALADVAAARRPAIVLPQDRPHGEQRATARALAADERLPVAVLDTFPAAGWGGMLERVRTLDGEGWQHWNDGDGGRRAARLLDDRAATFGTLR